MQTCRFGLICACVLVAACRLDSARAAIAAHRVRGVPTFPDSPIPFKYYSGYLEVTGPFEQNPYDKVKVRYELQMSQSGNVSDPLVSWHQGGPGWSSVFGSWGEMGYFQLGGGHGDSNFINANSWNQRAHMLYIEGPVGSAHPIGFGSCYRSGQLDFPCTWNDTSQAEMYTRTLLEFFKYYPELHANDYYISGDDYLPQSHSSCLCWFSNIAPIGDFAAVGESYGGRFIPNIANYILTSQAGINLKGLVIGNGVCHCSGEHCYGDDHSFQLYSSNESLGFATNVNNLFVLRENTVTDVGWSRYKLLYGHGMISTNTYMQIWEGCGYLDIHNGGAGTTSSQQCREATKQASLEHGNFNVVNVYDNCPPFKQQEVAQFYQRTSLTPVSLAKILRENLHDLASITAELVQKAGGFSWSCEEESIYPIYMNRTDVRQALHLDLPTAGPATGFKYNNGTANVTSTFRYNISGPDSFTLYPFLVTKLRVLIYSGDVDACVPNLGSQMWTSALAKQGVLNQSSPWHPWFDDLGETNFPLGYATNYEVPGYPQNDFTFLTIRMAGHMVPNTQPAAALSFFNHFLHNTTHRF